MSGQNIPKIKNPDGLIIANKKPGIQSEEIDNQAYGYDFKQFPKATSGEDDKQKCIDAGVNDYTTKPIDIERLLSLMRVWLSQ